MKIEIEPGQRIGIGPYSDVYGHGPVTVIEPELDAGEGSTDAENGSCLVCLDCGYIHTDIRMFAHTACGREHNPINQTWREFLDERLSEALPVASNADHYPLDG